MCTRMDFCLDSTAMQEKKPAKEDQAVTAMKILMLEHMLNGSTFIVNSGLITLNMTIALMKEYLQKFAILL